VSNEELIVKALSGLLTGQQEMSSLYKGAAGHLEALAEQQRVLAEQQGDLVSASEKQEQRLQDLLEIMTQYAQGQVDIRKTLADYGQRLEALEKKAS